MSRAIVYVAAGRKYVEEAYVSAQSVRRHMATIPIYLKLGRGSEITNTERQVFSTIDEFDARNSHIDKHRFLDNVTEERVLFLDGDTHVCADLSPGFDLLDRFELAAAHAPVRLGLTGETFGVPAAFPQYNTGVIFCRNTDRVRQAFRRWAELYDEMGKKAWNDQPPFRIVMWKSDLVLGVLPPEFNARLIFPTFVSGKVYLIHCREQAMEQLEARVNADFGLRVFNIYKNRGLLKRAVRRLGRHLRFQR